MYAHHFTSSDVNISLELESKKVYLDTAVSIAYTTNITSVPVYELGSPVLKFFSSGNVLVQGQLDLVFTGFEYIPRILAYLIDAQEFKAPEKKSTAQLESMTTDDIEKLVADGYNVKPETYRDIPYTSNQLKNLDTVKQLSNKIGDSLVSFRRPIDINLDLDNMNATMNGYKSVLKIKGCKFTSHSFATTSRDDTSIVLRYTFLAQNVEGIAQQITRK